mmetsp:Transcript_26241/g.72044  ORF Transcript_26241/g.72044 Transcript_26241/m.72044 type:complete len:98 (-) Transcript_26241:99-392(-)
MQRNGGGTKWTAYNIIIHPFVHPFRPRTNLSMRKRRMESIETLSVFVAFQLQNEWKKGRGTNGSGSVLRFSLSKQRTGTRFHVATPLLQEDNNNSHQ